jgi:hypothetical protein
MKILSKSRWSTREGSIRINRLILRHSANNRTHFSYEGLYRPSQFGTTLASGFDMNTKNSKLGTRLRFFDKLCHQFSLQLVLATAFCIPALATNKFCLKSNKPVAHHTITTNMEISPFNRLLVQVVQKNRTSFLFMRAQTKDGVDFWTHSQTVISSQGFRGRFQDVKAFQILSSPNTSRIKWQKQFSLLRQGKSYILVAANRPTPFSFQFAPMSECEDIIF